MSSTVVDDWRPRALLVLAHPREDSLTARVADHAHERLAADGFSVDLLDLYAEGFDPRMTPEDEPEWGNRDKEYPDEVRAHMRRIAAADTIVVVFPVWWFGPPAMLKGWIDRVWNYGFAYGRGKPVLGGKRMLWIGMAGYSREDFAKDGMGDLVERHLLVGISRFCGVEDASVHLVHGTVPGGQTAELPEQHVGRVLASADTALDGFLRTGREHVVAG